MDEDREQISYLSADDILDIHELIVESNADTTAGVSAPGDIEYTVEHIRDGHFGRVPETLHEKAFQLLRLIAANHPFVDGNKRTALMSTRVFYALNGLRFDYDRGIKEILKELATDEANVDPETVIEYLREQTVPLAPEYKTTIDLWSSRIRLADQSSVDREMYVDDSRPYDPNDYDSESHTE